MIFPFFVGCDRSGTTLVRAMFDSHPNMAVPGESFFIVPMAYNRKRYEEGRGFATDLFLSDLFKQPGFLKWNLSKERVMNALAFPPPENYAEAIQRLFCLYAQVHGKSRFGDKTPPYVRNIPLLAQLFPEARFVHIIRDGRNVALSIQEIGIRSGPRRYKNIGECAIHWKDRVELGRNAGQQIGPDRYLEVRYEDLVEEPERIVRLLCQFRYEDLVEEPERIVRLLCQFVDLEFHDQMLRYFERAETVVISFKNPAVQKNIFLPPTKNIRDWRSQMPKGDLVLFEMIAGDLLQELGYGRAVIKRPKISIQPSVYLQGAIPQIRHVARRIRRGLTNFRQTNF
jgi:hypothetical protein